MVASDRRFPDLARRRAVLFDFDGTLVDSGGIVLRLSRIVLECNGYGSRSDEELQVMIGPPLDEGFHEVVGSDEEESERLANEYRVLFAEQATAEDYRPYPGARELLRDLRAEGRRLAVATSRLESGARDLLAETGLDRFFDVIVGRVEPCRTTKSDSIREALVRLDLPPTDAVMVGDRSHDVEGALEVGVPCIGMDLGLAAPDEFVGAVVVCRSFEELRGVLDVPSVPSGSLGSSLSV